MLLNCHQGGTSLVVRSTKWLPVAAVERQMSKDDPSGSLPVRRKNVLLNFSSPPSCHVGRLLIPNTFWVFLSWLVGLELGSCSTPGLLLSVVFNVISSMENMQLSHSFSAYFTTKYQRLLRILPALDAKFHSWDVKRMTYPFQEWHFSFLPVMVKSPSTILHSIPLSIPYSVGPWVIPSTRPKPPNQLFNLAL